MVIREQGTVVKLDRAEWEVVLRLASLWGFDDLKGIAENEVGKPITDPVEKCEMGKTYDSKAWMDAGIVALAVRTQSVSASEASRIGYDIAYRLQVCREAALRNSNGSTMATRLRTAISDIFGLDSAFLDKISEFEIALPTPEVTNLTGQWQETYSYNDDHHSKRHPGCARISWSTRTTAFVATASTISCPSASKEP